MAKYFRFLILSVFIGIGLVGYSYFGPPAHTRFVTQTNFFREYIGPNLEKLLSFSGEQSVTVAYLTSGDGDLSYRPSSELVFLPARDGQALFGGTLVSAGEGSRATITLVDNSTLTLESNSTILLETPKGTAANKSITLKVIKGTVAAQKEENSSVKVKLVSAKGVEKNISSGKKTVVIAQKRNEALRPDSAGTGFATSRLKVEEDEVDEIVGTVKEDTDLKALESALFEREPVISARARAISKRVAAKSPESEINLDDVAQLASALEAQSKEETKASALVIPANKSLGGASNVASSERPKAEVMAPKIFESLPQEFLDELNNPTLSSDKEAAQQKEDASNLGVAAVIPAAGSRVPASTPKSANALTLSQDDDLTEALDSAAALDAKKKAESAAAAARAEAQLVREQLKVERQARLAQDRERKAAELLAAERTQELKRKTAALEDLSSNEEGRTRARSNLLSNAVEASSKGELELANRYYAKAMTRPEYASSGFSEATRLAVDGLMGTYIQAQECGDARNTIENVMSSYGKEVKAQIWAKRWRLVLGRSCN